MGLYNTGTADLCRTSTGNRSGKLEFHVPEIFTNGDVQVSHLLVGNGRPANRLGFFKIE